MRSHRRIEEKGLTSDGMRGVICECLDSQEHEASRPESPFRFGAWFLPEQFVEESAALLFFLVILDEFL
jgi:hypothetical protein